MGMIRSRARRMNPPLSRASARRAAKRASTARIAENERAINFYRAMSESENPEPPEQPQLTTPKEAPQDPIPAETDPKPCPHNLVRLVSHKDHAEPVWLCELCGVSPVDGPQATLAS